MKRNVTIHYIVVTTDISQWTLVLLKKSFHYTWCFFTNSQAKIVHSNKKQPLMTKNRKWTKPTVLFCGGKYPWWYHRYRKAKIDCLSFVYVPTTSAAHNRLLFFFFLLRPFTVLMKKTRAVKQSIFLRCLWMVQSIRMWRHDNQNINLSKIKLNWLKVKKYLASPTMLQCLSNEVMFMNNIF